MNLKDRQRILWLPWKLRPESRLCVREEAGVGQVKTRVVTSPGFSLDDLQQIKQEMHGWENSNHIFFNADCEAFLLTVNRRRGEDDCTLKKQSRTTCEQVREGFPPSHMAQGSWFLSIITCTWESKSPQRLMYFRNLLQIISLQGNFSWFVLLELQSLL